MSDTRLHPVQHPPRRGVAINLVYGECECGWWAALPEGSHWPACPLCGELVTPPRISDPVAARGLRLGFVAVLTTDYGAAIAAAPTREEDLADLRVPRHFTPDELRTWRAPMERDRELDAPVQLAATAGLRGSVPGVANGDLSTFIAEQLVAADDAVSCLSTYQRIVQRALEAWDRTVQP